MAQSNVGIRINIDTGQAKGQVEDLSRVIADLNKQMKEAADAKDWKSVAQLSQAIDSASSGRGNLINQGNQAIARQQTQQAQGGFFGGQGMWVLQQSLNQITHGILMAWDAALTAAKQRASGDYTGAAVSRQRAHGEIAGQAIGSAVGALGFLGGPIIGMMTTALAGEVGKFIGGIGAKKTEERLSWSEQYKRALPGIDVLNQLYGGAINNKSPYENNQYGLAMRGRATESARGTGLDTERFIEVMGQIATYGKLTETQALNMTRTQALWGRFTGADLGTIQKQAGQAYRFGGETNATATAYGGLMAQGMGKGQFAEFLNSLERVMADGISKGFVKSTEEISANLSMFYDLSGKSQFWQGKEGADRYLQMSNSISGATALQTTAHDMVYSVAQNMLGEGDDREANFYRLMGLGPGDADYKNKIYTGTHIDTMALIERMGASGKMIGGVRDMVTGFEGNENHAAIIEWYKQIYGLNNLGAMQLHAMIKDEPLTRLNSDEWEKKVQNEILSNKDYKSDSGKLADILNDLQQKGIQIGQVHFNDTELRLLQSAQTDIELIRAKLVGDPGEPPPENIPVSAPSLSVPIAPLPFPGGTTFSVLQNEILRGRWDKMSEYYASNPDTDLGKTMLGRVGTGLNAIDFDNLSPNQERVIGIDLENFIHNFSDRMSFGISDREYREIDYNGKFERMIATLERIASEQGTRVDVNFTEN